MISLIFPTFNEEENLVLLHKHVSARVAQIRGHEFEFIFIDDCSSDNTPDILRQLHKEDRRVKVIRFSRNSGSHAAITCGLKECRGEAAIVMAADLQDPPELISSLIEEWRKGFKVVWGVRTKREGEKATTNFFSGLYYRLMNWLTTVKMPPSGSDVFLVDRAVVNAFKEIVEKHTSVFMTIAWMGFKQSSINYVKRARHGGVSKWSLQKKIKLVFDSLLAFSDVPIRYMSVLGFLIAFLGFIYAIYVFYSYLHGSPVAGWSSLMVAILVIGGVQMMMLGFLGEYLWRTYDESRRRPRYIVEYKID